MKLNHLQEASHIGTSPTVREVIRQMKKTERSSIAVLPKELPPKVVNDLTRAFGSADEVEEEGGDKYESWIWKNVDGWQIFYMFGTSEDDGHSRINRTLEDYDENTIFLDRAEGAHIRK